MKQHRVGYYVIMLGLFTLIMAACSGRSNNDKQTSPPPNDPTKTISSATLSPVMTQLQQDYETLQGAHQTLTDIWEGLAANEQIRCGSYPRVLNPASITARDETAYESLADVLYNAAIELDRALTLWQAECLNPRQNPTPDVINAGRLSVRAAGDALRKAQTLLVEIQP